MQKDWHRFDTRNRKGSRFVRMRIDTKSGHVIKRTTLITRFPRVQPHHLPVQKYASK
jgi:hypothetical protein